MKGWIRADWGATDENRRARYYRLTSSGKKQLAAELKHFQHIFGAVLRVLQVS